MCRNAGVAWLNNGTYTRAQVIYQFIIGAGDPNGLNGWTNWLAAGRYTLDQGLLVLAVIPLTAAQLMAQKAGY